MSHPEVVLALGVLSYLIGGLPFGVWVARHHGVVIQEHGSGNIGATNVARVVSRRAGLLVLALDVTKGALATAIAWHVLANQSSGSYALIGAASVLGHCFSPFLRLSGGKGVATGLGVCSVICASCSAVAIIIFALLFGMFRRVSAAALTTAVVFPGLLWWRGAALAEFAAAALIVALIGVRHVDNIRRLRSGNEPTL